jgi:LAO/AO transport system kinase
MNDAGSAEIIDAIEQHGSHLRTSDSGRRRLQQAAARELHAAVEEIVLERLRGPAWEQQVCRIAERETDPYSAAIKLIEEVMGR